MVHETPDTAAMGWSGHWWCVLMYLAAIATFSSIAPPSAPTESRRKLSRTILVGVRLAGLLALIWLAFAFRGPNGRRIVTLVPFSLDTEWYGILGLIGWAYWVASLVFLVFRQNRTAILGCMVLLLCLFVAGRNALFEHFWLNRIVGIGETLGSLPAIAVGGLLLGSMLAGGRPDMKTRTKFVFWFIAASGAAALLLSPAYGISKNAATPAWCLWSCAITAALWYGFSLISEIRPANFFLRPLMLAGQNVLLAYLLSEMLPGLIDALGLSPGYGHLALTLPSAIARSAACGVLILVVSSGLNRIGFRIKL